MLAIASIEIQLHVENLLENFTSSEKHINIYSEIFGIVQPQPGHVFVLNFCFLFVFLFLKLHNISVVSFPQFGFVSCSSCSCSNGNCNCNSYFNCFCPFSILAGHFTQFSCTWRNCSLCVLSASVCAGVCVCVWVRVCTMYVTQYIYHCNDTATCF